MATIDTSSIQGLIQGYLSSGIFWVAIIIIAFFGGGIFYGYFSRKSKLKYNCIELVRFGNGKVGINKMKAGLFGPKRFLGMFDYGREKLYKTSDGRVIEKAKTSHLHDLFGKKGFIVMRSPKDPKILVPIGKVDFESMELLLEIAPADYRDASVRIFREAVEETKGTWEKILPYIAIAFCIILALITVVITMQMVNHATDKVGDLLIKGCTNQQNVAPASTTTP